MKEKHLTNGNAYKAYYGSVVKRPIEEVLVGFEFALKTTFGNHLLVAQVLRWNITAHGNKAVIRMIRALPLEYRVLCVEAAEDDSALEAMIRGKSPVT